MLLFQLGNSRYAIPVADVVEVAPRVDLEPVARSPHYVAGLFNYRGRHAPVIDLCQLTQQRQCADSFTTRIVMVDFPLRDGGKRTLGLLAEQVTETADMDPAGFSTTGLHVSDAPWLGEAAYTAQGMVQQISIAELLPEAVQAQLFAAGDS
jgi:chemotaxis-related protein WspB